jgi:hypothetical protein
MTRLEERGAVTVTNGKIEVNQTKAQEILKVAANSASTATAKPKVSEAAATKQLEATMHRLFLYDDNDPSSYEGA